MEEFKICLIQAFFPIYEISRIEKTSKYIHNYTRDFRLHCDSIAYVLLDMRLVKLKKCLFCKINMYGNIELCRICIKNRYKIYLIKTTYNTVTKMLPIEIINMVEKYIMDK